jgi:hypothetical protein
MPIPKPVHCFEIRTGAFSTILPDQAPMISRRMPEPKGPHLGEILCFADESSTSYVLDSMQRVGGRLSRN